MVATSPTSREVCMIKGSQTHHVLGFFVRLFGWKPKRKPEIQVIQGKCPNFIPKRWRSRFFHPLDFGSRELTIPKRSRLESPGSYFLVFRGGFLRVETCQTHITLLQRPTGFLQFVCVPMWQDSCGLGIPSNGGDIVREVSPKCLNSSGLGSIVIYPD